ncbi:MAG: hypothetical protein ACRDI2_10930 [Chloroflexota bacterium]
MGRRGPGYDRRILALRVKAAASPESDPPGCLAPDRMGQPGSRRGGV